MDRDVVVRENAVKQVTLRLDRLEMEAQDYKGATAYAAEARKDIGDWQVPGAGRRKAGWVENPVHPSTTTDVKPTDWIGNPDSPQWAPPVRKRAKPKAS